MKQLFFLLGCAGFVAVATAQMKDAVFTSATSFTSVRNTLEKEATTASLKELVAQRVQGKVALGFSHEKRPVELRYFPGISKDKVLIIGGVHGSELSAIALAATLSKKLSSATLCSDVLLIPCLFPDNAAKALLANNGTNEGRYSCKDGVDPNRQMPGAGWAFNPEAPADAQGRLIEKENRLLLQLIQEYKPRLIINLHAIRDVAHAGFYADPRTDCSGLALGFEQDSLLALHMAKATSRGGGFVPGNRLDSVPTALYYKDPSIAAAGTLQKRNREGSALPTGRGNGVSLGTWATTAVCKGNSENYRAAITLITVEFPGYKMDRRIKKNEANLEAYAKGILSVLCPIEETDSPLVLTKTHSK